MNLLVTVAQFTIAIATVALAIATITLAKGASSQAQASKKIVQENREMVKEMREARIAQDRPQIIVDADYSDRTIIHIVVRNIGQGAAKDISFEFSEPLISTLSEKEGSKIVPVSELPYFREGIEFLAPGSEIECVWDSHYGGLWDLLRERGLQNGITISSSYTDLLESHSYKTVWKINPLLHTSSPQVTRKGVHEIAEAVEKIAKRG